MTLHELDAELTMLRRLAGHLDHYREMDDGGALLGPIRAAVRRAIAAAVQQTANGGDEWLFVHKGQACVLDTMTEVADRVAELWGPNAPDAVGYSRLPRGGIGIFCPGSTETAYFLGRFPRGTIKV